MKVKLLKKIRKNFLFARSSKGYNNYMLWNIVTGDLIYLTSKQEIYHYMIGYFFSKKPSPFLKEESHTYYIDIGELILKQKRT